MAGLLAPRLLQSPPIGDQKSLQLHTMSAMKKTNTKTKSPAPATSATKSTRKKATTETTAKATPAPVSLTSGPAASPVPPQVIKALISTPSIKHALDNGSAPLVKAVAPAKVHTKIIARVDVGFGNTLYIRGDGPGLTWSQGVAMECVGPDQWEITLAESARPVSLKVLVNDQTWCTGPDTVVASGSTTTITPDFA